MPTSSLSSISRSFTLGKALLLALGAVVGMALIVLLAGVLSVTSSNQGRVAMGVQTEGHTIAGLTYEETRQYFQQLAQQKLNKPAVSLEYNGRFWSILPADIGLEGKADEAAQAAFNIGRNPQAGYLENLITQMKCAMFGQSVKMTGTYDEDLLTAKLTAISQELFQQPVNATAGIADNGGIRKTPSQNGVTLNIAPIKEELVSPLQELRITAKITLQPDIIVPFVTDADLATMDAVLSSYTTYYYPGDRGDNIELAASQLHGAIVKPGSGLSFNAIVGPRTHERGYKDAGVIIDGKHEIDSGGGVCQVSTTLYNAILLAGLTPTQRSSHYYASSYCPAGFDATVADDLLDFQFYNNLKHPVYILSGSTGSSLTFYVLGTWADLEGNTITLESEGSSLNPSAYRIWSRNGEVVEEEFLHTDHYSVDTGDN